MKYRFLCAFWLLTSTCWAGNASILPIDLRCEYLHNPLSIDVSQPRLSWRLQAVSNANRNINQSAYEIICASSKSQLKQNRGDLWATGKVNSSTINQISYSGTKLEAFRPCFWKVRVRDQAGRVSPWSEVHYWQMGPLKEGDWQGAQWIGLASDSRNSSYVSRRREARGKKDQVKAHASGLFRLGFNSKPNLIQATLYVSGLGYNEVTLNGKRVGDHVLDPGQTCYDVQVLYSTFDVTSLVKAGDNALGIMLGNGFYGQNVAFTRSLGYDTPRLRCLLRLHYDDGSIRYIRSNNEWKGANGPILFDNVYGGETYDARLERPGWREADFDDTDWDNVAIVDAPGGGMKSMLMPPIRRIKAISPVRIIQNGPSTWTLDYGQNISGWAKIQVREKAGTEIYLRYAESLFCQRDEINPASLGGFATGFEQDDFYICKGGGLETWEPRFTYHGFQFIEVTGLSKAPSKNTVKAVVVHNDVKGMGTFSCSDSQLNRMFEVSQWTVLTNLHSIPEDCPHREKCGWLGDAHAVGEFSIFSFDMARFYTKYMADIKATLGRGKRNGALVPTMVAPGKRLCGEAKLDWGVAIIYLPWYLYQYYGDEQVFRQYYDDMKVFVEHMLSFKNQAGVIENGLGDWCPPRWDRKNNPDAMECHPHISANAFFYHALKIMQFMADRFDDKAYAQWAARTASELKDSFNENYLIDAPGKNSQWYGSQTSTVMALNFGLVPEEDNNSVLQALLYDIEVTHQKHHSVGIHGHRPYYSLLASLGQDPLAYDVLTNPTFPSQAYIINTGLTTWPERQWEWGSGIEWDRSLNHPMQAGFAAFLYESVLGIKPCPEKPGFETVNMKPHFIKQLQWTKGEHQSPYGKIASHWYRKGSQFNWKIELPPGVQGQIHIPCADLECIKEGSRLLKDCPDIKLVNHRGGDVVLSIGSGSYHFLSTLN